MWTRFMDMHSGGSQKEKWPYIYIEAPEKEAISVFYNRFGHNPKRVTCACCGADYSISSNEDLAQLTAYDRGCIPLKSKKYKSGKDKGLYRPTPKNIKYWYEKGEHPSKGFELNLEYKSFQSTYRPLKKFMKDKLMNCFIPAKKIKLEELTIDVPEEGYIWVQ